MELQTLITNADMERDGVWFDYGDAKFRIASENSPSYQRAIQRHTTAAGAALVRTKPELLTEVMVKAMADAILIEWEGVKLNGQTLECHVGKGVSKELREKTLVNKFTILRIPALRNWMAACSQDLTRFQVESDAEQDKTLGEP